MTDDEIIRKEYEGVVNIKPLNEYGEHYYCVVFPDESVDVLVQDGSVIPIPE